MTYVTVFALIGTQKIKHALLKKKLQTLLNKERISYITTNSHPNVTLIS